jgi:predicted dehydrogenase
MRLGGALGASKAETRAMARRGRMSEDLGIAVVGVGYWGPNLIRNFSRAEGWDLQWVCDLDRERAMRAVGKRSTVSTTTSIDDVLDDPAVSAVAIATPAHTHAEIAIRALDAGKHVLIEKPLAVSVAEGEKIVSVAEDRELVLMCDHTYCYTPAVSVIRELVHSGAVGDVQYVDSVRINLGLVQSDVDVFWDLGPHDLSILDFILPESTVPTGVAAYGADPLGVGQTCVGYMSLPLSNGGIAHAHVNWLSPTKIRTTIIGGSERMIVWDDLHPTQRISLYDKGVTLGDAQSVLNKVSYRIGDMIAPALNEREALQSVVDDFRASILECRKPLTDGAAGLRVLRMLEAASTSLLSGGAVMPLGAMTAGSHRL